MGSFSSSTHLRVIGDIVLDEICSLCATGKSSNSDVIFRIAFFDTFCNLSCALDK